MQLRKVAMGGRLVLWFAAVSSAVITLTAIALAPPAKAQGVVRDIQVVGNRRVEPETVRSYLQFNVGDPYDAGKADRSLRALFATGLFADIEIDRQDGAVIITVVENPVVNQVAFEGNSEVDAATLEAEVQLKPRSVYTRSRALSDAQRILDVYRRQGRFAAVVEPKLIELEQNRVNVVFEINEGTATKVKGIHFVGNRAFSDSQLRDIITTTQAGWFDFLKGNSIYDPDRLSLDRELLRQYYLKNGYADARIVSGSAELDRDGSGFFLTFVIEEGELYSFGEVRIESALPDLRPDTLRGELLTKPGDIFNASDIDKTVEKLTLVVSEQGFAFARVRPRADRNPAVRAIDLVYDIDEGPRVYIDRINIVGNMRTKDHVIRREFRLAEGDAYNPMLVDRAKKRLQALGFFKSAEVKRRPGSAHDRVVLDVEVVEQPTGELSFGAGYSTNEGVIGDVSITERNLLGNGQFLRLKVGGSMERFQIDLSFTEPRFLDRNIAAGFDLFHKEVDQTSESSFRSRRTGGSLRMGFPIAENLWMSTSYTLSHDNIFDVHPSASRAVLQAEGTSLTSAIGSAVTYDTRNHPRNPNRGLYFQVGSDFAGVGGDVQYIRVQGEGRAYYPITEKITFVGRVVGGHIDGWGGEDVRLLDLYYRGGETVRGFDRAGYGPRDTATGDSLGGKTFWAATAEVRFPLPLIPDELGMSGAVFADAGSLFGASDFTKSISGSCGVPVLPGERPNVCLADDATIRSSVGVGLLWNSPLGPLRLDYAYALTKESYDKTQQIRFGASTKF
ncbi:MAG: outer membrane protein assembly factor BamA [Hyphomicrobiaceae bacterium]|nr:outer membrane protein assembly factor BamA [Hyphomicrobiaceae bacterium]